VTGRGMLTRFLPAPVRPPVEHPSPTGGREAGRGLLRDASTLGAGLVAAQLITVLTYWLTARSLGLTGFGLLLGTVGLARMAIAVADFGINRIAIRDLARDPTATSAFVDALAGKLVIAVLLGVASTLAAGVGVASGILPAALLLLGPFVSLQIVAGTLQVPLRAVHCTGLVSFVTVLDAALPLLVVVAALPSGDDAVMVALPSGLLTGAVVVTVSTWWMLEPRFRELGRPTLRSCWQVCRASAHFGLASMMPHLQRADVAIVGMVAGPVAAGLFAVPARLTNPLSIIPHAFSTALLPRIAGAPDRPAAHHAMVRGTALLVGGTALVLGGLFVLAEPAIGFALGSSYLPSAEVLRVTLVGVLVAALNQPMAVFLQAEGHERFVAVVLTVASAAGLAGIAVGASVAGAYGAAFGFVLLQLVAAGWLAVRLVRVLDRRRPPASMPGEVRD
jgi:O-antigen/teichoic acid export membrane protein